MAIPNMSTFYPLEAQCVLLFRSGSMILMFLKEVVINCIVGDVGDSRGTSLAKLVRAALPTSKANL
jgi:hypothetical protein